MSTKTKTDLNHVNVTEGGTFRGFENVSFELNKSSVVFHLRHRTVKTSKTRVRQAHWPQP